jgi:hypothetical protein
VDCCGSFIILERSANSARISKPVFAEDATVDNAWNTVFFDTVEERPVKADVHPTGLVKVTTTPIEEIAPDRVTPDQELIALEIREKDRSGLERALRAEGFSDAAVSRIISQIPA